MYGNSSTELGFVSLALNIALLEKLVERNRLTADDARAIVTDARNELKAAGNTVNLHAAARVMNEFVLPKFSSKA